ncbi:hypothetical protein SteCoe_5147 [Stentor coeruleus]|uniref:STOP protein n=1 Tax=Stentor coeruleus TaxID=5963 RepID=A0A1R2CT19_9CILI|nr:hypothetical protein SteCoe_5147 [Stentor coeruleus]
MKKRPVTANNSKKRLCPLSDPSVGIVSENDHKVGLCLCKYCDCGEHTCPVLSKNDIHLKSAFCSSYMQDFQKSNGFDSPLKPQQKLFRPNSHKMDFTTTNQADFKPIRLSPKKPEEKPIDTNKAQFRGYSIYANDFPDWGENNISHEKRWYPPLRTTELSFKGTSTYKESFRDGVCKSSDNSKNDIQNISASKTNIFIAPKDKFDDNTTYRQTMRDYSSSQLNKKIIVMPQNIPQVKIPQTHFSTTNKNYFNNSKFSPDPRLYKLTLMSRSQSVKRSKSKDKVK